MVVKKKPSKKIENNTFSVGRNADGTAYIRNATTSKGLPSNDNPKERTYVNDGLPSRKGDHLQSKTERRKRRPTVRFTKKVAVSPVDDEKFMRTVRYNKKMKGVK